MSDIFKSKVDIEICNPNKCTGINNKTFKNLNCELFRYGDYGRLSAGSVVNNLDIFPSCTVLELQCCMIRGFKKITEKIYSIKLRSCSGESLDWIPDGLKNFAIDTTTCNNIPVLSKKPKSRRIKYLEEKTGAKIIYNI